MPWARLSFWVGLFVLLNLGWRIVRYGVGFPIWGDEAMLAISIITRDPASLLQPLEFQQIAPIGFLWAEWAVTQMLGTGEYALRLLPFLAGLISVPLFVKLARCTLQRREMVLAIAIFAASYYPVRHAAEIKPYSFDLLAALLVLLTAWNVRHRQGSGWAWALFAAVAMISVWFSYPAAFIAGGAALWLATLVRRERSVLQGTLWIGSGVLLTASFAAMYFLVGRAQASAGATLSESGHWNFTFPPLSEPWLLPIWFLRIHTGNMFAYPTGGHSGGSTLTFLLFVFGIVHLWRGGRRAIVLLLLSPLPLMFIAAALEKYPYGGSARVTQFMTPSICLLAGAGLVAVARWCCRPRMAIHTTRAVLLILAIFAIAGIVRDLAEPYKKFADLENKRIIIDLAERTSDGDVWVMYGDRQRNGPTPWLLAWGGSFGRHWFQVHRFHPVPVHWGVPAEELAIPPDGDLWLIVYKDNVQPFPQAAFDTYLDKATDRLGEPRVEQHDLRDRNERIKIYRFQGQ